jgi:hypothetical protein
MSAPKVEDWAKLKHLARYLVDKTRYRSVYKYQGPVEYVTVCTDTDYAGCHRTRKSTSGGVLMHGNHVVKSWSSTQNIVSLSTGEAEYYGLVKGAAQAIGLQSMLRDINVHLKVKVKTDASAAKGIATRRGIGRVRHIEVHQLWVQDKVAAGELEIVKIPTHANPADNLTKYLGREDVQKHICSTSAFISAGRHHLMPEVARGI